jgi:hypothetical protein
MLRQLATLGDPPHGLGKAPQGIGGERLVRPVCDPPAVILWGFYSDVHPEVDITGDREGLRLLAAGIAGGDQLDVPLDRPPAARIGEDHPVNGIQVRPRQGSDGRICFVRSGDILVMAGSAGELAHIVGSAIRHLADGPSHHGPVASHVHLDPTSDPERQHYTPDSISLVIGFAVRDD